MRIVGSSRWPTRTRELMPTPMDERRHAGALEENRQRYQSDCHDDRVRLRCGNPRHFTI